MLLLVKVLLCMLTVDVNEDWPSWVPGGARGHLCGEVQGGSETHQRSSHYRRHLSVLQCSRRHAWSIHQVVLGQTQARRQVPCVSHLLYMFL